MSNVRPIKSELFHAVWGPVKANIHEFIHFLPVDDLDAVDDLKDLIRGLLQTNTYESLTMATVLIGVLSNQQAVFLFSGSLSLKYLKSVGVSSHTSYKGSIKARLIRDKAFIKQLVPWKRVKQGYQAGLYTLSNPEITKLIPWWPNDEEMGKLIRNFTRVGEKDIPE